MKHLLITVAAAALVSSAALAQTTTPNTTPSTPSTPPSASSPSTSGAASSPSTPSITLSSNDQMKFNEFVMSQHKQSESAPAGFTASVGQKLPANVMLYDIPASAGVANATQYKFAVVEDKAIMVNPSDRMIVYVSPTTLAATSPTPSSSSTTAASNNTSSSATASASSTSTGSINFVNQQGPDQWLASKLIGTNVVGPDNKNLGDISDLLADKDGKVVAAVIGVGGFLGIGQKNVAVNFDAIQKSMDANGNMKLMLSASADQLKNAPDFMSLDAQNRAKTAANPPASGGAAGGGATTPSPSAPPR